MDKKDTNDVLRRNVALLSKIGEKEASMMPAIEAPLPSVEQVMCGLTNSKCFGAQNRAVAEETHLPSRYISQEK